MISLAVGCVSFCYVLAACPTRRQGRRQPRPPVVSSLAAFWPGLEVLAGDVAAARAHLKPLLSLAAKYGSAPEIYDVASQVPSD